MLPVFGAFKSYSISSFWARVVLVVSALLPILVWFVSIAKRYEVRRPPLKDVAILGVKLGLAMFLALSAMRAFETANGYFDSDARIISAPVLDIVEQRLRTNTGLHTSYYLVVEDWHGSGRKTELFWGSSYPEGWNVTGNCLNATVGPGAFDLRWIADEKIAPCRAE